MITDGERDILREQDRDAREFEEAWRWNQVDPDEHIGYLTDHPSGVGCGFLCVPCGDFLGEKTEVYGVNINPYQATCVRCGTVVVKGCGIELMDGR